MYSENKPDTIYCPDCWWSDKWDPISYAKEYNSNRSFFEQFSELREKVPALASLHQRNNENCDFANYLSDNKNCYLIFAASYNEDCYYDTFIQRCRKVVDSFFVFDSENCYRCIDCYSCYNLFFSQECESCSESYLLFGCRSCQNCIGSIGLANKQCYILNKKTTKEEFEKKRNEILSDKNKFEEFVKLFEELKKTVPHKYYSGAKNENFVGDHIYNCKNTFQCFDVTNLEDCKYCHWLHKAKDCFDVYGWGLTGELGYENHLVGNNFFNVKFCYSCSNDVSNLTYCSECCNNSKNLFGCVSLTHKEFCILNKQYSEAEYNKLTAQIIEKMKADGEWGEFYPMSMSPFCYNETQAQEFFPLTKEGALKLGAKWLDEDYSPKYEGSSIVPEAIEVYKNSEVKQQELLNGVIICEKSGKPFKITAPELAFYIENNLSIPTKHYEVRYEENFTKRNPRKLYHRKCMNEGCKNEFETTYAPERPEKIYCEKCYLDSVG